MTRPTNTLGALEALAPLVMVADAMEEVAVLVVLAAVLLLRAANISIGTAIMPLARSTDPSASRLAGFAAKNELVYITFSAIYDIAHSGMDDISRLAPQLAAVLSFAVIILVYVHMADIAELLATIAGIMLLSEVLLVTATVAGLIIPNIPASQLPAVALKK